MVFMSLSLRTKNGDAQRVDRADQAQIGLLAGAGAALGDVDHLGDVGDAHLGLGAADHRDQRGLAGGRLHQHVDAGLFLEHLGDGRPGRVVERARLHRGDAVGLRGSVRR